MSFFLLLQTASPSPAVTPVAHETLERGPAFLSLVFLSGLALMILLLLLSLLRHRRQKSALTAVAPEDLPDEVRRKLGATATNRGLKALRVLFLLMAAGVYGTHVYWARYAEKSNARFQELSYKDQRARRLDAAILNGWILDRSGKLDKALASYKKQSNGDIGRVYAYDTEFSQLFGTYYGAPGLERALFQVQSSEAPEALQLVRGDFKAPAAQKDVRLTIDTELQKEAARLLQEKWPGGKVKHGAVVALNPQTGEVLAMYSNPAFSIKAAQNKENWLKLDADKSESPLVNRALNAYYVPGSTFKTTMLIGAFRFGLQDSTFAGTGGGFIAEPGANPITDDNGSCEVCGPAIEIRKSFQISSNQYFAQMALALGPERVRELAKLLGIGGYDTPYGGAQGRKQPEIWNASVGVKNALAPNEAYMVTGAKMRRYDLALEGFGQGYAGQMTPLQMAMIVSAAANLEGKLMKPKIEYDRKPEPFSQVLTPEQGAQVREIMGLVTLPGGTGAGALANVTAQGIRSGGKTGTAQKQIPVYDPRTGQPKTARKYERDAKGNIIREYDEIVFERELRSDAWYLSFAPLDKPVIALAVVVEGPGPGVSNYGGRNAAPIAAQMLLKAKQLGYFGGPRNETPTQPPAKPAPKPRRR
jgi:hypothetical protein